jgi:Holliday junction DNA helicase RuvA
MIGKLKGVIDSYGEDFVVLDVGGVGYLVHCSARTLQALPAAGEAATMSIETHVREDQIRLFGFTADAEREWFRLLQTVQNVGARVALNVLSALSPRELERALALSDRAAIGRAQGVGPKLALRIVTELKDKAPAMMIRASLEEGIVPAVAPHGPEADAVSALTKLGYSPSQAAESVARVVREQGEVTVDVLIREALRGLGR